MKSKRIKQSILFSSVLLMGSTLFYNSSAKADTSTSSNSNAPTMGVSSPQKAGTGFNNFVDNVSAKNSSVKDKISNANTKGIDPADSAANKANDLTSEAKNLSDQLPTGEAKQDSQEKINEAEATLDKYKDLEEKVPDEDWYYGFPERSDQERYEAKTNTKIIVDSPDLEISPLENNSIIYNGKVHSYTFDNGKSSFLGFTGSRGNNKAFNITNLAGDYIPDETKWVTIDGNVLIKNSFDYDVTIVDKGAPKKDIIKDSGKLGVVITDSDDESPSFEMYNHFNISELAIITPYGNVLHHVVFKNINPDPNAAKEPHGFYSLIDTALDGRDNVPIMSDDKGGLYITDGNLVYAVRPLDGHATAYATDFRVAGKDNMYNQSADRLPDSGSKVVLNNVDTAIRIATPKVTLPYGHTMDFWFIETSYLLNGASDVEKSVNDHFDAEIADLLNKIDKASDSVKNAQSKADDVLGTIGKATDIDGAIDNTVKQATGHDPKAIKDAADDVSSNVSDTISNVKDGYNSYKNNVASTAITDKDKALTNRIENGANAVERGANTIESAGKGIIDKIAKPLQILSTIGNLKNTISDIHNSITKVNDIVDSSAASALNVLATTKNVIISFSTNAREATNAAIDIAAGKLKDYANQKINNVRKDVNKKIDDENNKVKKKTKDFLTNSGESILTTIIQSIVSTFATVFAGIAAGFLLHPLIGLGAAALAGMLVNFLWTGKLFGKQLFDGINSIVKSSKKDVNSMTKTTEDTVNSVIDEAKDRFKKKVN